MSKICLLCNSNHTYIDDGYPHWYKYEYGYICMKCYHRIKISPKTDLKENPKRMSFKNKRIRLKHIPRIGKCSYCSNNIQDGSCKMTHLHHIEYDETDITKSTVELCPSCHMKETWRNGGFIK